jgi:ArsR family transcriptional regulator
VPASHPIAEAAELTRLFGALSDTSRIRILNALGGGELCVCDIVELLELPQSTASRHLAILREEGLVIAERRGRFVHYRLSEDRTDAERALLEDLSRMIGRGRALERERRRAAERSNERLATPCVA